MDALVMVTGDENEMQQINDAEPNPSDQIDCDEWMYELQERGAISACVRGDRNVIDRNADGGFGAGPSGAGGMDEGGDGGECPSVGTIPHTLQSDTSLGAFRSNDSVLNLGTHTTAGANNGGLSPHFSNLPPCGSGQGSVRSVRNSRSNSESSTPNARSTVSISSTTSGRRLKEFQQQQQLKDHLHQLHQSTSGSPNASANGSTSAVGQSGSINSGLHVQFQATGTTAMAAAAQLPPPGSNSRLSTSTSSSNPQHTSQSPPPVPPVPPVPITIPPPAAAARQRQPSASSLPHASPNLAQASSTGGAPQPPVSRPLSTNLTTSPPTSQPFGNPLQHPSHATPLPPIVGLSQQAAAIVGNNPRPGGDLVLQTGQSGGSFRRGQVSPQNPNPLRMEGLMMSAPQRANATTNGGVEPAGVSTMSDEKARLMDANGVLSNTSEHSPSNTIQFGSPHLTSASGPGISQTSQMISPTNVAMSSQVSDPRGPNVNTASVPATALRPRNSLSAQQQNSQNNLEPTRRNITPPPAATGGNAKPVMFSILPTAAGPSEEGGENNRRQLPETHFEVTPVSHPGTTCYCFCSTRDCQVPGSRRIWCLVGVIGSVVLTVCIIIAIVFATKR